MQANGQPREVRIRAEPFPPELVTHDRDGVCPLRLALVRTEGTAELHANSQNIEVVRRDEPRPYLDRRPGITHRNARAPSGGQRRERLGALLVGEKPQVAEATAWIEPSRLDALPVERDELIPILDHRRSAEGPIVVRAEHRGVGTDTEGEDQHGEHGEAGLPRDSTERIAHVLQHCVEELVRTLSPT